MTTQKPLAILYSFRRCPYAMRARLALWASGITVELREVVLRNKPAEMLVASPKATVPVLLLNNGEVIDESLQVMQWALTQQDPHNWLPKADKQQAVMALIEQNDNEFKYWLDRYKYADRYPAESMQYYRQQGEKYLADWDERLRHSKGLFDDTWVLADWAILPFVRQFAHVDRQWFDASPYHALRRWMDEGLNSQPFHAVMGKYPAWQAGDEPRFFGRERHKCPDARELKE